MNEDMRKELEDITSCLSRRKNMGDKILSIIAVKDEIKKEMSKIRSQNLLEVTKKTNSQGKPEHGSQELRDTLSL